LKQLLEFSGIVFEKNKFEKKENLSCRFGPSLKARLAPASLVARPCEAHLAKPQAAAARMPAAGRLS
jgi:hypothetical protein